MNDKLKEMADMLELPEMPNDLKDYLSELLDECEGDTTCAVELFYLYEAVDELRETGIKNFSKSLQQINRFIDTTLLTD